jgi:hypothetical protein
MMNLCHCLVAACKGRRPFPLGSRTIPASDTSSWVLSTDTTKCNSKLCYERRSVGQSVLVSIPVLGSGLDICSFQTVRRLLMWGARSTDNRGNFSSMIVCFLDAGETTCPRNCFLAKTAFLSLIHAPLTCNGFTCLPVYGFRYTTSFNALQYFKGAQNIKMQILWKLETQNRCV